MTGTYLQNKKSIYNYRLNHPEKIKKMRVASNRRAYIWRKISREFLAILRD